MKLFKGKMYCKVVTLESLENPCHTTPRELQYILKSNGYNEGIHYIEGQGRKQSKNRSRNIIWFNPPYNQNVRTNIAKSFLCQIDKHFPKSHKFHKIFNRNNLKVSYSCTTNMANIIKSHNQKILNENNEASEKKNATVEAKTFALLTVRALSRTLSTKQLSQHPLVMQGPTLV